ncbi:MAG: hypothetical protein ACKVP0_12810 [Pirellulaceae bacterium]
MNKSDYSAIPISVRRSFEEKNNERRRLFEKRWKRELTPPEEKRYKKLHRGVMRFCKKHFSDIYQDMKELGRSKFTRAGQMIQKVRKRRQAKKLGR